MISDRSETQKELTVRAALQRDDTAKASTVQRVAITRIELSIGDLVWLLLKLLVASIPIALAIAIAFWVARAIFLG